MERSAQNKSMQYLLGRLSEKEMAEFEAQCFEDEELFVEMVELESDLLHSYIRGELSPAERQEFETGYLVSPARRRNLEFTRMLEERLGRSGESASVASRKLHIQASRHVPVLGRSWVARAASVAIVLIAVGVISWLAVANYRLKSELSELRAREGEFQQTQKELEAQIAALTSQLQQHTGPGNGKEQIPHVQPPGPAIVAFNLVPGFPRTPATSKQLIVPYGVHTLDLHLYLENDAYTSYRASVETREGKSLWRRPELKSQQDSRGRSFLSLAIPSNLLKNGDYIIKLAGTKDEAVSEDLPVYAFSITKR